MKPTPDEVKAELETLKQYRALIPPRTFFGDDNIARIDAEIRVLEKGMTERQIDNQYGDSEEYYSAYYARQWLDGFATDGSMSDNWKPLAEKKR